MGGKTTSWGNGRAKRLYDLTIQLGSTTAAAAQISKEIGHRVSEPAARGALRQYFPEWQSAMVSKLVTDERDPLSALRDRVADLETENKRLRDSALSDDRVRREILGIADAPTKSPDWLTSPPKRAPSVPGVPCLGVSDEHWGEVVDPAQVNGVNEYNLEIARKRLREVGDNALDVLFRHTVNPKYPGLVLAFPGDGTTGDIHEELSATNDVEIMPCVLDLRDHRVALLDRLLAEFPHLFVVGVTGNHGRNTLKLRSKGRAHTSFDWLGYQLLARHYAGNKRITFHIPEGPDALFRIYHHRYLLSHGDQFRGGDGMVGALGPIIRGDHKKRTRNQQIDRSYDTLVMGHWHQSIFLRRVIVCPALKGYDEYASAGNFPFEAPGAALWLTHHEHGPTVSFPVFAEKRRARAKAEWISWAA